MTDRLLEVFGNHRYTGYAGYMVTGFVTRVRPSQILEIRVIFDGDFSLILDGVRSRAYLE